eukprot:gene26565-32106_t
MSYQPFIGNDLSAWLDHFKFSDKMRKALEELEANEVVDLVLIHENTALMTELANTVSKLELTKFSKTLEVTKKCESNYIDMLSINGTVNTRTSVSLGGGSYSVGTENLAVRDSAIRHDRRATKPDTSGMKYSNILSTPAIPSQTPYYPPKHINPYSSSAALPIPSTQSLDAPPSALSGKMSTGGDSIVLSLSSITSLLSVWAPTTPCSGAASQPHSSLLSGNPILEHFVRTQAPTTAEQRVEDFMDNSGVDDDISYTSVGPAQVIADLHDNVLNAPAADVAGQDDYEGRERQDLEAEALQPAPGPPGLENRVEMARWDENVNATVNEDAAALNRNILEDEGADNTPAIYPNLSFILTALLAFIVHFCAKNYEEVSFTVCLLFWLLSDEIRTCLCAFCPHLMFYLFDEVTSVLNWKVDTYERSLLYYKKALGKSKVYRVYSRLCLDEALTWFHEAAMQNQGDAALMWDICHYSRFGRSKKLREAIEVFVINQILEGSEENLAKKQYALANMWIRREGVQNVALELLQRAANRGNMVAQYRIGKCFIDQYKDTGFDDNLALAEDWLSKASQGGHKKACKLLMLCYELSGRLSTPNENIGRFGGFSSHNSRVVFTTDTHGKIGYVEGSSKGAFAL